MKVVVGSENEPKVNAVKSVFTAAFPGTEITFEAVRADSGVSSHPISTNESILGATNRAMHASELAPGADYYVGIEGGLLVAAGHIWEMGWVAVQNAAGEVSVALSSGPEMKGKILKGLLNNVELNKIIESDFGIQKIGDREGYYGLVTNGIVPRQAAYEQGIAFALAQFLHPEFYQD